MSHRMLQINELLRGELANLIREEVPLENGLITITDVKCSPDLRTATVNISVLPENQSGTSLKELRKNSKNFSKYLKKNLNLKFIPNFTWRIDSQTRYANELNKIISDIQE